jgi:lysophospholipase L1-like esterase
VPCAPNALIDLPLKECATYFPSDIAQYQHQFVSWVETLRAVNIQAMLVTIAPIAEPTDYIPRAKLFVKRLAGKPAWLDSNMQFNNWLKQYAQRGRIPIFDLDPQLQRSDNECWLQSEDDVGDKIHLNKSAYHLLDESFAKFLTSRKKGS